VNKSCPNSVEGKSSESRGPKRLTLSEMRPVPRRGLSRIESAMYIGVSPTKFDALVADGRMPKPVIIDGRKVWDRHELDISFDGLPRENDCDPDGWEDFSVDNGRRS
jgi:hypothetical protein